MKKLLRADLFRMFKSKMTLVLLILCAALPLLSALLMAGLRALAGLAGETLTEIGILSANTQIGGAYSLSTNVGLAIPVLAGTLVCTDFTNGTLRNKVVAGHERWKIYFSHLVVSMIFSVGFVTIYVLFTTGFSLLFLPYKSGFSSNDLREFLFWAVTGTMGFVYISTVSTFFAMTTRSMAPTILFTILTVFALTILTSSVSVTDYGKVRHLVYFIPTFSGRFFTLSNSIEILIGQFLNGVSDSRELIFAEGILSFLTFGVANTALGVILFCKRDLK